MVGSATKIRKKPSRVLIAAFVIILICGSGLIAISHMILNGKLPEARIGESISFLVFTAVFIGGQVLLKIDEGKLVDMIILGLITVVMMLMGGFLIAGEFQYVVRNLISVAAGCALLVLFSLKGSEKKKTRIKSHR